MELISFFNENSEFQLSVKVPGDRSGGQWEDSEGCT
jgi:hypothetical protein